MNIGFWLNWLLRGYVVKTAEEAIAAGLAADIDKNVGALNIQGQVWDYGVFVRRRRITP